MIGYRGQINGSRDSRIPLAKSHISASHFGKKSNEVYCILNRHGRIMECNLVTHESSGCCMIHARLNHSLKGYLVEPTKESGKRFGYTAPDYSMFVLCLPPVRSNALPFVESEPP